MSTLDIGKISERVRRVDEDRWLAARFAPVGARRALIALYAFNYELARIGEVASDPLIGEMRLTWWRETVDEIYDGARVRAHDVAGALAAALHGLDTPPPRELFVALIDARARDLDTAPFEAIAGVGDYAEATAGGLMRLATAFCGRSANGDERLEQVAREAGRAWGLTGLARAFAYRSRSGRAPVARAAIGELLDAADAALARARSHLRRLPADMWPAVGYAGLIPGYLRGMRVSGYDPMSQDAGRPLLARQTALTLAAARGRI